MTDETELDKSKNTDIELNENLENNDSQQDELPDIEKEISINSQNLNVSKIISKRLIYIYLLTLTCIIFFVLNNFFVEHDLYKNSIYNFIIIYFLFSFLFIFMMTYIEIKQENLRDKINSYTNKKQEIELENDYKKIPTYEEFLNNVKNNKEKITENYNENKNIRTERAILTRHINKAKDALSKSLTSADNRIQEYNKTAKLIGRIALELMGLELFIILLYWYHYEKIIPIFDKLNAWALPIFSFPILIILTIAITLFRHQKKLLDEVRHYSAEKRQIELYSGLLEASQYSAKSLNDPKKSAEYVQDTFTAIRDRLLSEQPHTNTAGSAVEQEEYSSSLEPLIKVISDMIAKSEVKK